MRQDSPSFGGIQVIALGDFFQLPPVPRYNNEGKFAFQSKLWDVVFPHLWVVVFPHTCLQKTVQGQREPAFIDFVNEIGVGHCSQRGQGREGIHELLIKESIADKGCRPSARVSSLILHFVHARDWSPQVKSQTGISLQCSFTPCSFSLSRGRQIEI